IRDKLVTGVQTCALPISFSFGQDAESLLKSADTAMYYAKEKGRNNFQFFKADMTTRAVARQSLEGLLGRALERHEFVLHYQPKEIGRASCRERGEGVE